MRRARLWLLVALVAVGASAAEAQRAADPVVVERPEWAIGDWWEFSRAKTTWRLTVIARSREGYTLVESPAGRAVDSAEGFRRHLTDLDGWILSTIEASGTPKLGPEKREWVKFPLKIGSRWFFSVTTTKVGRPKTEQFLFDYDCQAGQWETLDINGRSVRAIRIDVAHRERGSSSYGGAITAWYAPEAKRVVRITPSYQGGPTLNMIAFGDARSSAPVVAAAPPPPLPKPPVAALPAPPPAQPPSSVSPSRVPAVVAPMAKPSGDRLAVVVGIGSYEHRGIPKLRYATRDAEAIAQLLVNDAGFKKEHVLLLTDRSDQRPTLRNLKSALGTFLARSATRDDTVLVFFAGHGAPELDPRGVERDGFAKYLIPSDADPEDLYATALSMDEIQTIFSRIEADRVIMFVDACYSGASGGRTFASRRATARTITVDESFLDRLTRSKGRAIITASRPSEVSLELEEFGHGVFTYYVVQGLKGAADLDRDGVVTLQELYAYVEREVSRKARSVGGNQHPVLKGELEGPFPLLSVKPR